MRKVQNIEDSGGGDLVCSTYNGKEKQRNLVLVSSKQLMVCSLKYRKGDFPGGPVVKNLPCNTGDRSSTLGWKTKIPSAAEQVSPGHNY